MNELLVSAWHQVAENLYAIRRSRSWEREAPTFHVYCRQRWSLSPTRAKLLCDFAKFAQMCRETNAEAPETPDNVAPLLQLPQKHWLDVWQMIQDTKEGDITAPHCRAVMNRFGYNPNKRPPEHVRKGQAVRKAAKTLAEMQDGEALVQEIGTNALGRDWDDAVQVVIDADQERLNVETKA